MDCVNDVHSLQEIEKKENKRPRKVFEWAEKSIFFTILSWNVRKLLAFTRREKEMKKQSFSFPPTLPWEISAASEEDHPILFWCWKSSS